MDQRFTIGLLLRLAWRASWACRWSILLIGLPTAVVAVGLYWLTYPQVVKLVPSNWQWMVVMWQYSVIECVAFVAITFTALSYMRGQNPRFRDVLRIPWLRVPIAMVAGLILQFATFWPDALLDWSADDSYGYIVDHIILTINVLTLDVAAFVLLPVLIMGDSSLVSALHRSVRLALQHPWRILAADIGFWGLYFLFTKLLDQAYLLAGPQWANLGWSAMVAAWGVVSTVIACCLTAAAYHLLNAEQVGQPPEVLVHIFD
jgi:hypothetical protein